jgi:hypothetical protein
MEKTIKEQLNPTDVERALNMATLVQHKLEILEARVSSWDTPSGVPWLISEAHRIQEEVRNSLNNRVSEIKRDCKVEAITVLNQQYQEYEKLSLWKKLKLLFS